MDENVVEVRGYRKVYGDFVAVDGIDFSVRRGEVFGLLGPNGAGKTTTLEALEGLRFPDQGSLRVLGIDPSQQAAKLRHIVGVQLQSSGLPPAMTVAESMSFFAAYHGVTARPELFDRLGLSAKSGSQFQELSTGYQRRLVLALAILHDPSVLILDEPTAGLDVPARVELHALIGELQSSGKTIILATHDMAEAEKLADRVAILLKGKIVATGSPRELTAAGDGMTKVSVRTASGSLLTQLGSIPGSSQMVAMNDYITCFTSDPSPTVTGLLAEIENRGDQLIDLRVERPTLEERFLEITHGGAQ